MDIKNIEITDITEKLKPLWTVLKYGAVFLAFIITVFLVFDRVVMPMYTRHGTEFPLPNLLNKSYDEALRLAEAYDFQVVIRGEQPSPNIPEGTVLSQVPKAGTMIKENREVKVIISSGVAMSEVPDLSRFSIRQAELKLPENGLKVKNYYWTETDTLERDVIAYTIPPAGALVPKGSGVDLYINRGLVTDEGYIPQLVGKPLEEAQAMLDTLGFPEARIEYVTNPLLRPKIVTSQNPPPGTKIHFDSAQILVVVPSGE
jgi:serine/threonine-protein kinase